MVPPTIHLGPPNWTNQEPSYSDSGWSRNGCAGGGSCHCRTRREDRKVRMTGTGRWWSLGRQGGHVEVVGYNPEWPQVFEREAAAILEACRPWVTEVHHVGSASVPGLADGCNGGGLSRQATEVRRPGRTAVDTPARDAITRIGPMPTKHDLEVTRLVQDYPNVRAHRCAWCENVVDLPPAEAIVPERLLTLDGVRQIF